MSFSAAPGHCDTSPSECLRARPPEVSNTERDTSYRRTDSDYPHDSFMKMRRNPDFIAGEYIGISLSGHEVSHQVVSKVEEVLR